jgi:hypothetical protein
MFSSLAAVMVMVVVVEGLGLLVAKCALVAPNKVHGRRENSNHSQPYLKD